MVAVSAIHFILLLIVTVVFLPSHVPGKSEQKGVSCILGRSIEKLNYSFGLVLIFEGVQLPLHRGQDKICQLANDHIEGK